MDLQIYFDRGRYRGWLYLDGLVKQREQRKRLLAQACSLVDLKEADYCRILYSFAIDEMLRTLGFPESFWRQYRMGKAPDAAKRAFLVGFLHGIATFRISEKSRQKTLA